jgi:hypothetical protein
LSAGVFTLIASVIRLPYLYNLNQPDSDPTWEVVNIAIWSIAELGSAITLSSIPAIKPVWVHAMDGWKSRRGVGESSQDTSPSSRTGGTGLSKQKVPLPLSPRRVSMQGRNSYIHLDDMPVSAARAREDDMLTIDSSRDRTAHLE